MVFPTGYSSRHSGPTKCTTARNSPSRLQEACSTSPSSSRGAPPVSGTTESMPRGIMPLSDFCRSAISPLEEMLKTSLSRRSMGRDISASVRVV